MGRTKGSVASVESYMMVHGKVGQQFYSAKPDRHLTALANYYGTMIKTERLIAITTGKEPKATYITKVTIL